VTTKALVALAAACAVAACSGSLTVAPQSSRPPANGTPTPIKHVVFIVQENRSFNNLFMDYPGATTQTYGYDTKRRKIRLHAQGLITGWDIDHYSDAFYADCDGRGRLPGTQCRMDGWNDEHVGLGAPKDFAYAYVPRNEIDPYWKMAGQYVLADRMFASNLDGSFIAHQYLVAAYASRAVDYPLSEWGCEGGAADTIATLLADRTDGPRIRACFDNPTIGGEADRAGVSWRFYADTLYGTGGLWSSYQANRKIFKGPDWSAKVVNPPSQFLTDVGNGQLANITWIAPTFPDSDHPGLGSTQDGPAWVTSLVDAIGTSKFWKSTAIFIMWDDWGGWFDPVKPVYEDYDGLGFRVPLLIISPYAKRGYVTHVQYETSSVPRFIEDNFGLPQLAASDARANDPATDAFDYHQSPRAFRKIGGAKPSSYWIELERRARAAPTSIIGDD
jgi:phospholipase C